MRCFKEEEEHHQQLWAQNDLSSKVEKTRRREDEDEEEERESVFSPIRKRRVKEFYRGNKTTKEERVGFIKQKREMEMEFKRKGATSSFRVCLFYLIP